MSVKKLLVLGAAAFAAMGATAAMAGGPDHMAMPSEPAFQNNVYVEGHLGYAQSNWDDFNSNNIMGAEAVSLFDPTSHGKGGFTGGLDLGYAITQHIAVEGGWFYIPQVKGDGTTTRSVGGVSVSSANTMKVNSWLAYTVAKLTVPVASDFDLFGKVGVAYRALTYSKSLPTASAAATLIINSVTGNGHYWAPVFATGVQYNWGSWLLGAQYMYLPGASEYSYINTAFGAPNAAPEVNLYTGFLGYKFNV